MHIGYSDVNSRRFLGLETLGDRRLTVISRPNWFCKIRSCLRSKIQGLGSTSSVWCSLKYAPVIVVLRAKYFITFTGGFWTLIHWSRLTFLIILQELPNLWLHPLNLHCLSSVTAADFWRKLTDNAGVRSKRRIRPAHAAFNSSIALVYRDTSRQCTCTVQGTRIIIWQHRTSLVAQVCKKLFTVAEGSQLYVLIMNLIIYKCAGFGFKWQ